ncbi:MAG: phosphatase PAP2 family protein [Clostridia bacterium]|nr:phosphatase PAP2 family protein [Clostridia bacterium]
MELLYWFESIRNPVFNAFFSAITWFGHELIPIGLICVMYWCINKKLAYRIGFSFFFSGISTQALKITFRIPRPWVIDKNFSIVGDAKEAATSYSFPSGHTQSATSTYSSLALCTKKLWLRIILALTFVLVGISRMYLGVHTLNDVIVAMVLSLTVTLIVFKVSEKYENSSKFDIIISALIMLISAVVIIYSAVLYNKGTISHDSLEDCVKSGASGVAFGIGYMIEKRFIDFDVRAKNIGLQILKVAAGLGIALGLKSGLKYIVGESVVGDGIRYFILVFVIIVLYPLVIKAFSKKKQ